MLRGQIFVCRWDSFLMCTEYKVHNFYKNYYFIADVNKFKKENNEDEPIDEDEAIKKNGTTGN